MSINTITELFFGTLFLSATMVVGYGLIVAF
jgi:hypothetical protein